MKGNGMQMHRCLLEYTGEMEVGDHLSSDPNQSSVVGGVGRSSSRTSPSRSSTMGFIDSSGQRRRRDEVGLAACRSRFQIPAVDRLSSAPPGCTVTKGGATADRSSRQRLDQKRTNVVPYNVGSHLIAPETPNRTA
uniref:Uncharacterized protein n=1 Tax=Setaria viridis TaxID=4556 RepID=A0A4U6TRG3_SETVI|nr:hypothetical protein SEVIR_8G089550v2 [Setaria viridis]